jgi:flagellar FliJ protein
MKKFNFRLQRVIDVREIKEKLAQRALGESLCTLKDLETQLDKELQASNRSAEKLRKALNGSIKITELNAMDRWRYLKEEDVQKQTTRTNEQRDVVDQKRQELIQAAKNKKILERLKEQRLEDHRNKSQKEEQSFLDELGSRSGATNRSESKSP